MDRLRIAAISFLNPAPLLWDFQHEAAFRARYEMHYTLPARCAAELESGEADLGLVPIASLPQMRDVVAVPGCTIASMQRVRSIQLVLKPGQNLNSIRTVAADSASRSSAAYVRTLLHHFYGNHPQMQEHPADLQSMLESNDAALLIGDPALQALEARDRFPNHTWIDLAQLWRQYTGLPWVAAVWAVRPESLLRTGITAAQLSTDLQTSRDHGLAHTDDLVRTWSGQLQLSPDTVRTYLTENIHYQLDEPCLEAIQRFYDLAAEAGVLPPYRFQLLR